MGEAPHEPRVGLHEQVQESLAQRDRQEGQKMLLRGGAAGARAAGPGDAPRDRKNGACGDRNANRRAGGTIESPAEEVCGAEHARGAKRGECDIEPRLREKSAPAVQRPDERRVERVRKKHNRGDPERAQDVRCVHERSRERCGREEQRCEAGREGCVDDENAPLGLCFATLGAGDGPRHALDGRGGDDVVRDVRNTENGGERPVSLHADDVLERRLLHEAHENEPDFGTRDGDAAAPRASGFAG